MRWLVSIFLLGTGAACSDAQPCSSCPNIQGVYDLRFDDSSGTPAECVTLGVSDPVGPLTLGQFGSGLTGTLGGTALRGTLYDTFDFSLSGVPDSDGGTTGGVTLHCRFIQGVADGGDSLRGTWGTTVHQSRGTGPVDCTLNRPVTGSRR